MNIPIVNIPAEYWWTLPVVIPLQIVFAILVGIHNGTEWILRKFMA